MKNKLYIYAFAAMAAMSLGSCSDFLDADNKTAGGQTADDYFSTAQGLTSFRTYAYYSLRKVVAQTTIFEDGTDLYIRVRSQTPSSFQQYSVSAEDVEVKNLYISAYGVINNANGLLQYGGEDSQYAPDARFLRAYGYYILTQQFGAVPLSTTYINNANREYPRASLSEIYDFLISDLTPLASDSRLPKEDLNGNVSQRAVCALLSKICLAAGWDMQTTLANAVQGTYNKVDASRNYFTESAEWAEKAIANGAVSTLALSFEDKWSPFNEANGEEIWSVQYAREGFPGDATNGGHGLQNDFGSYYGNSVSTGYKYALSSKAPSLKSVYLWDENDTRYEGTFMTTFYNYSGDWAKSGYFAYYNNKENRSTMPIGLWYAPYYTSTADAEKFIADNKERFARGEAVNDVMAFIVGDPMTVYTFKADGSYTKSSSSYIDYQTKVYSAPSVKKFDDAATIQDNTNSSNCYRDIVLFHLSDMYLTAAEAYYMSGNEAKALDYINVVRRRSSAPAIQSLAAYQPAYSVSGNFQIGFLDLLLDERARELYGENQRWMDLRRTRQLVRYNIEFNSLIPDVAAMSNPIGEVKWYRPIPAEEISSNSGMTTEDQNPGY